MGQERETSMTASKKAVNVCRNYTTIFQIQDSRNLNVKTKIRV
jgi:hypothetical protein